jgi:hypothetical protein
MGHLIKKNTPCKNPRYPKLDAAEHICSELSCSREQRLKHAKFTDQFTPSPIQSGKLSQLTTLSGKKGLERKFTTGRGGDPLIEI